MPGIDFDELRRCVTMEQVLRLLDFTPRRRFGSQLRGPCPIHHSSSERSRTFSVNLATGRYYCFKCGSFGHQLELWAAANQLNLYTASLDLCRRLAIDVPWIRHH
jgi:DNA primase